MKSDIRLIREFFKTPEKSIAMFKERFNKTGPYTRENLKDDTDDDGEKMGFGMLIVLIIVILILVTALIMVIFRLCKNQYRGAMLCWAVLFISPLPFIGSNGIGILGCLFLMFMKPNNIMIAR